MKTKTIRHNWKHHSGDATAIPSTLVERCAYCGVLTKKQEVETARIGLATASFRWRAVPVYSTDGGATWAWDRPVCCGKPVTA